MDRYILFDPNKFLKEAKGWKSEKKKLQEELKAVLELTGLTNSEVHSTSTSDPTSKAAEKRFRVSREIDRLDNYQRILEYGLANISETNREILEAFYFTKGKALNFIVDELSEKYRCSPRQIYRMKNEALEAFSFEVNVIL